MISQSLSPLFLLIQEGDVSLPKRFVLLLSHLFRLGVILLTWLHIGLKSALESLLLIMDFLAQLSAHISA